MASNNPDSYPRFSDAEYQRRYRLLREAMDARELDALVVYGQVGISGTWQRFVHYLTNYADTHYYGYCVFPKEGDITLFIAIYPHVPNARLISVVEDVRWGTWEAGKAVGARVGELNLQKGRIGLVGPSSSFRVSLPLDHYEDLRRELPGASFEAATDLMEKIFYIKSGEEIEAMERGARFTDLGMKSLVRHLKPGADGYDLHGAIVSGYIRETGALYSFQLCGATPTSNPTMPYPWKYPSERRLEPGDLVVTEISAAYNYYAGQLIRTCCLGDPPRVYQDLFGVAKEAYENIQKAVVPGATEQEVFKACKVITDNGFKIHAPVLHGWSVGIHWPLVGLPGLEGWLTSEVVFKEGMCLMIEPNPITPDEKHGVFFGDVHVLEKTGLRPLQKYPRKFVVV
ncbi:MAG: aminopeptidase P family protein [Candidatus Tectomicrobia bacterium]|nr:aminopeptidase P family protein [Candidatus Tectomicrobia bacterium]